MDPSVVTQLSSRRYASLLRELWIFDRFVQSKALSFDMQMQTQSNWCWAATSTSVSLFYWFLSPWTQCKVANAELGRGDCCNSSVPSACNVPWYLDRALTRTDNFVSITGPATFQQVRDEIDAGRPVGARIGWSGGGGHFMVLYGYSLIAGTSYFDIDDPIYGKSHLSVSDFSSSYQGSGTWTHTYFTKSYFKLPIKFLYPKEEILRRIWEHRPLLKLKQSDLSADASTLVRDDQASLGLAHRMYTLGLDSLSADEHPAFEPIGIRVYELIGDRPRAFFDVTEDETPRVLQASASEHHLEPFRRALAEALTVADGSQLDLEVRLLRVPALNFEGLWLAPEGDQGGQIIPLRAVGQLVPGRTVGIDQALAALREAAGPLRQMDDTMGA